MIEEGTDSHLLNIARVQFMSIDGRLRGQFTLDWYCSHHKAGAMTNASTDVRSRNTKYVRLVKAAEAERIESPVTRYQEMLK